MADSVADERERKKRRRRSEKRKDYDGVQRKKGRTKEESKEKLRKRGTKQKREVSLSRTDVACARPG